MKECEVCGSEFYFKNRSKKVCSNSCRQQAYRNRKGSQKEIDNHSENQSRYNTNELDYRIEFNSMVQNFIKLSIQETLSYFEDEPIHVTQVSFLKNIIDIIEFHVEPLISPEHSFHFLRRFVYKMVDISYDYQDEYGFIIFREKGLKKKLNRLEQMLD